MIELMVAGSGSAVPTTERGHPAVWLRYDGETFLLDCGEGTQRQLMFSDKSHAVDNFCITHWHLDHSLGMLGILRTMDMEMSTEVDVYAPNCQEYMDYMLELTGGLDDITVAAWDIPAAGGPLKETPRYSLRAFPTDHGTPSYGFVFQEKERWNFDMDRVKETDVPVEMLEELREKRVIEYNGERIAIGQVADRTEGKRVVYTGDTLPVEETVEAADGADLLIHDATYQEGDREEGRMHSTAREAAEIAREAGVDKLMLIHFSRKYDDVSGHLEEAKEVFPDTIAAEDFMELKVI